MRGFEKVSYIQEGILPVRSTAHSAGYDISIIEDVVIMPGETKIMKTGIKAYMQDDEVLELYIRSSIGIKKQLMLSNIVGIIDSDYYNNVDNEGHIMIALYNYGNKEIQLEKHERVAQAIFKKYLITTDDETKNTRVGGIGSTN